MKGPGGSGASIPLTRLTIVSDGLPSPSTSNPTSAGSLGASRSPLSARSAAKAKEFQATAPGAQSAGVAIVKFKLAVAPGARTKSPKSARNARASARFPPGGDPLHPAASQGPLKPTSGRHGFDDAEYDTATDGSCGLEPPSDSSGRHVEGRGVVDRTPVSSGAGRMSMSTRWVTGTALTLCTSAT